MLTTLIASFAFASLPQGGQLRFVVYGDDRDGHAVHRKIVALIAKEEPSLVFNTGDLVRAGSAADLWKTFDDITTSLRKTTDYYAVRGNHDVGTPRFESRFAPPESKSMTSWFSFDRADSHFIGLCIDGYARYGAGSDQYKWLASDLAAASKRAKHTFVFFHIGPYSIGAHGSNLDVRKALCPLFVKYRVDAVFTGHDHIYYRTRRDGVNYIVTGGGGAELYDVDPSKGAVTGDKWEKANNYVVVGVSGPRVSMKVRRADGTVIESFNLTAQR